MKEDKIFHRLLRRQILKNIPDKTEDASMLPFFEAVNDTYNSNDDDRMLLEHSLEVSSEELLQINSEVRTIFEAFPDMFLRIDIKGKILEYKSAAVNISRLLPEQILGRNIQDFPFMKIDLSIIKLIQDTQQLMTFEHFVETKDHTIYFEVRVKSLLQDQIIVIIREITDRVMIEEKLRFAAMHDTLTHLPNRALLNDRLLKFINRKERNPKYFFAVLFIDFDRFKLVNDSLGHQAGDELLISISKRLLCTIREVDTVARLGGDEFGMILDDVKNENDVKIVLNRIQNAIASPFFIGNKEIFLTMSIGVVICSDEHRTAHDYLRDADIAMYNAKKNGKAQYMLFNHEMHLRSIKVFDLEGDLNRAIKNHNFEVYYQPIISLETNKISRFEALVRWNHHEKGVISPTEFIPQAEQTGLIFKIGEFVLLQACTDCKKWQSQGYPNLGVSINFSALQFHHTDLFDTIKDVLTRTKLDPNFLEIEITESAAVKNIDSTFLTLRKLKEMHIKVSIDDFGTGYSSLESLIQFPIDCLKIDRKFIMDIMKSKQSITLTTSIIGLAHNLGLKVTGEGIETADQLQFLTLNNCDEGQGYFFAKPMPFDKIQSFLKNFSFK